MLSHNQLKYLRSLSIKKYRDEHGQFLVEGEKMLGELLRQTRIEVSGIFGISKWANANERALQPFADRFTPVTEAELDKISGQKTPNQVLALAQIPAEIPDFQLPLSSACFYLDGIQDPGNMGSILRVADWFGFPAVFCSPDCVDVFSPKVVQASMGAIFRVKTWEASWSEWQANAPSVPVLGAVLGGENVFATPLPPHGLLVVGNEGRGISAEGLLRLTHRIGIPRHPDGAAESLNAAVAAGILAAVFRAR